MFWTVCGLLSLEGFWRLRAYVPKARGLERGPTVSVRCSCWCRPGSRLRWPVAAFPRAYQV